MIEVLEPAMQARIANSIGGGPMAQAQALTAWAALLDAAAKENATLFDRGEWNLLADCNNGMSPMLTMVGEDMQPPHGMGVMWANAQDAIRLDKLELKWHVADPHGFIKKLMTLDYVHSWAAIVAVQWFWEHSQCIDHSIDEWWTPAFRQAHLCLSNGV